ncbi:M23 family metallopeptidase [Leucobacter viscericola]|uniref:M23 family metallopeptidase n=1 Tax=Leucobacter viscericola TaxID=2714935 RepID=A0A6G7XHH1_9MICO|nr:M23 family metallopeptidase [Leucobacter viscericola]QIK63827.1 M23 family metallopeptidase [Leucobacter viscericola]
MAELFWPFDPALVSEWPGTRPQGWADHVGTDFAVAQGTPLRATMSGIVDIIWNDGLGAWVIDIIAPDGTVARHGHLSRMDPKDGQWVNAGDVIGLTGGALGTIGAGLSTGSHLHWEIRDNRGWGPVGWYDPRSLPIKAFPKHAAPAAPKRQEHNMLMAYYEHAAGPNQGRWAVFGPKFWMELSTQRAANAFAQQLGLVAFHTDAGGWAKFKRVSK